MHSFYLIFNVFFGVFSEEIALRCPLLDVDLVVVEAVLGPKKSKILNIFCFGSGVAWKHFCSIQVEF